MANSAIPIIEILRVGLLQSLHELTKRVRAALNEQVHVIRHQAVGIDSDVELRAVMFQTVQVSFVVVIAPKRFSLLIAAHDDMIKETWRNDSGTASHGETGIKDSPAYQDCSDCDV